MCIVQTLPVLHCHVDHKVLVPLTMRDFANEGTLA